MQLRGKPGELPVAHPQEGKFFELMFFSRSDIGEIGEVFTFFFFFAFGSFFTAFFFAFFFLFLVLFFIKFFVFFGVGDGRTGHAKKGRGCCW